MDQGSKRPSPNRKHDCRQHGLNGVGACVGSGQGAQQQLRARRERLAWRRGMAQLPCPLAGSTPLLSRHRSSTGARGAAQQREQHSSARAPAPRSMMRSSSPVLRCRWKLRSMPSTWEKVSREARLRKGENKQNTAVSMCMLSTWGNVFGEVGPAGKGRAIPMGGFRWNTGAACRRGQPPSPAAGPPSPPHL